MTKLKNPQLSLRISSGAQNWIRTSTPLRALRPEHSASTNFAIWATGSVFQGVQIYRWFLNFKRVGPKIQIYFFLLPDNEGDCFARKLLIRHDFTTFLGLGLLHVQYALSEW